jgi:N-formylglutamate amidohydrolase
LSSEEFEREVLILTDWYTDGLFKLDQATTVKASFSRLFCDVERFVNDSQEVMAKQGMGVLYTRTDDGRQMRKVTPGLREQILREYYWPHHKRLETAVRMALDTAGRALIVDGHSFPDRPLCRDLDQSPNRPDINIGTDDFHTSKKLAQISEAFFTGKGLEVVINRPYSGTIVPLSFLGRNRDVMSIMVEVNRKLYLEGATNKKSKGFSALSAIIDEYLGLLTSLC